VTAALIVVVVIALGLPLLAWWVGGRRFWARLRPRAVPDPWGDAMRRFRLLPAETAQVESAVNWGRRLDNARLRQAAAAWAQQRIDQDRVRFRIQSPWARVALLVAWLAALAGALTWLTMSRGSFPWDTVVWWVLWSAGLAWLARGPRRALRLNAEPASDGEQQPSKAGE
jgi:hypothetical protein